MMMARIIVIGAITIQFLTLEILNPDWAVARSSTSSSEFNVASYAFSALCYCFRKESRSNVHWANPMRRMKRKMYLPMTPKSS